MYNLGMIKAKLYLHVLDVKIVNFLIKMCVGTFTIDKKVVNEKQIFIQAYTNILNIKYDP